MAEKKKEIYLEEDEIDLREVIRTLWQNKWLIIIFTLIMTALSAVIVYKLPPKYKTSAVILKPTISGGYTNKLIVSVIDKLNLLVEYKNLEQLEKEFNFSSEEIENLASKDFLELRIDKNKKKEENFFSLRGSAIAVYLYVKSPQVIKSIIDKILNYLNSDKYINELYQLRLEKIKKEIEETKSEIKRMEKVKQEFLANLKNMDSPYFNPQQMDEKITALRMKILNLQHSLKLMHKFKLLKSVPIPQKPYWPKKGLVVVVTLIMSLFIGIFLVFIKELLREEK